MKKVQKTYSVEFKREVVRLVQTSGKPNGPVEGQINRLKCVKRSMFGRGSFELLRNRFLEAA